MIRAANHSSFPKVDESPLDQVLRHALARAELDKATPEEVNSAIEEVITIAVAQQGRAFIDVLTDGMVRWPGPHSHLADHIDGLERGPLRRWFDTNFYDHQLEVVSAPAYREPFLVHDYQVAAAVALTLPVKPVLPGPVTAARLASDKHFGDLDGLADALADVLAEEVRALTAAGATFIQLDEPLLCAYPSDLERVCRTAGRVFEAAGDSATTILSTYFGDLAECGDELHRLPGTHLGLDMTGGSANFALLQRLPVGKGVALGLFDARTTRQEDAADVAEQLQPHREALTCRDVLVGPNAGLELLPRSQAFDKLLHARYVVEKLSQEWTWRS